MTLLTMTRSLMIARARSMPVTEEDFARQALPGPHQPEEVRSWKERNADHVMRGWPQISTAVREGVPGLFGCLWGEVNGVDYGLISTRVITDDGAGAIAASFLGGSLSTFNYHALGTGSNAEAATDTGLQTELTTEYSTDNVRPSGAQSNPSANVYESIADVTLDAAVDVTEHGLLNSSTVGGGLLMDRAVFAAVSMLANDIFRATYQLTIVSGS